MKGNYLITTLEWFYASDGKQYKAVWGNVEILDDNTTLGIKTNLRSTNWYAKIGSEKKHIIVAGCQINYAVKAQEKPNTDLLEDYTVHESVAKLYIRPTMIYLAQ